VLADARPLRAVERPVIWLYPWKHPSLYRCHRRIDGH
jgi:hypothetical protein